MAIGLKIVDGDYIIDNSGTVVSVSGKDKCARDFEKMLITEATNPELDESTDRYNPIYGTRLNDKALYSGVGIDSAVDMINFMLAQAIQYYITLQEQRNNLSADEIISDIEFTTYPDIENKQQVLIDFTVYNGPNAVNVGQFTQVLG
jgi:hypothetical protein